MLLASIRFWPRASHLITADRTRRQIAARCPEPRTRGRALRRSLGPSRRVLFQKLQGLMLGCGCVLSHACGVSGIGAICPNASWVLPPAGCSDQGKCRAQCRAPASTRLHLAWARSALAYTLPTCNFFVVQVRQLEFDTMGAPGLGRLAAAGQQAAAQRSAELRTIGAHGSGHGPGGGACWPCGAILRARRAIGARQIWYACGACAWQSLRLT